MEILNYISNLIGIHVMLQKVNIKGKIETPQASNKDTLLFKCINPKLQRFQVTG